MNSPLISNSVVNNQTIKNWICSKCYELTSLPSFYEISDEYKKMNNQIKRQFTIDSFESYANQFKKDYFSSSVKTDAKTSNLNAMEINSKNKINPSNIPSPTKDNENNNTDNDNKDNIDKNEKDNNRMDVDTNNIKTEETKETKETEEIKKTQKANISKNENNSIAVSEQQVEKEFWNLMNKKSDLIIKCGDHLINEKYGR